MVDVVSKPHIFQVLQARPGGSSGSGISYWSSVYECPRRARLAKERKALGGDEEESKEAANIGVYYHALHEFLHTPSLREEYVVDMTAGDFAFQESMRLFSGYRATWGDSPWGEVVACEVGLVHPDVPDLTGRIDAVVRVPQLTAKRGLILEPGYYLLDHKSSKQRNSGGGLKYEYGLQAAAYLSGWNKLMPGQPARGMIFDCIYRHKEISEKSFDAFLVTPQPGDVDMLRTYVDQGKQLVEADFAFAGACVNQYGGLCPFAKDQSCARR
jgi:hypothetical protein